MTRTTENTSCKQRSEECALVAPVNVKTMLNLKTPLNVKTPRTVKSLLNVKKMATLNVKKLDKR